MARHVYKVIPLSEISSSRNYDLRLSGPDQALTESVRRRGILQPLITTPGKEIISGYRRLAAARTLSLNEVPALVLEPTPAPQEAFLLSVLSNWHQPFSEIEKAGIVFSAKKKFGFEEKDIFEEIFPALKINPDQGFYQESLEVLALEKSLIDLIATGQMPFRGARILSHLNAEDQAVFASLAAQASFTTNQLLKMGEWLRDLLQKDKLSLKTFLEKQSWQTVLKSDQPRNGKGEQIFHKVRALRFPNVEEKEKQFSALSGQVKDAKTGLCAEMPPFFEGDGFIVKARLNSPDSLEAVISALQGKRKVLNSLLDIVL